MVELPEAKPVPFNCPHCGTPLLAARSRLDEGKLIIYFCVDHGWYCFDDDGRLQRDHRLFAPPAR